MARPVCERYVVHGSGVTARTEAADGTIFEALCAATQDVGLSYSEEVLSAYVLALKASAS